MKTSKSFTLAAIAVASFTALADFHHTFEKGTGGWVNYSYWGGKLEISSEAPRNGKKSLKLTATEKRNRIYGLCICPVPSSNLTGTRLRLTFYAKGSGELAAGILNYTRNGRGGEKMDFVYSDAIKLTDQYQKFEYIADYSDSFIAKASPAIELRGNGYAYIDDVDIVYEKNKNISMKALDKHQVLKEGSKLPVNKFKFTTPDETVHFFVIPENNKILPIQTSVISDEKGIAAYEAGAIVPVGEVRLTAAANGVAATVYNHVIPAAEYDELDKIAASIKLNKPCHILVLGDSISDRSRGMNHIDKLAFWLNKYNPGKVSFQNLAVSGDFITRVEKRMTWKKGQKQEYRQWVYNDLHNRPYDLIIIMLGANDCASFKSKDYKVPQVLLKDAEASFKRVIALLRTKSKAPIVLVSPFSNDLERSKKEAALSVRWRGPGAIFGLPEFVKPFNAMLKKTAAENNCYFVDIYSPLLGNPAIPSWHCDGVHLTPAGYQAVSGLLLKALAAKGSPLK